MFAASFRCCLWPFATAAFAESKKEWDDCTSSDADLSIKGCNTIIGRGKETKNNLAIAYYNRGIDYQNKGDHDKAIADFNQSIKLTLRNPAPTAIAATPIRADRRVRPRHHDYNQTIKLKPDHQYLLRPRLDLCRQGAIMPARSTIIIAPSSWIRTTRSLTTIAATPMPSSAISTRRSPISTRRSRSKPDYALGHANRGWVLAQRDKHAEAVAAYTEAIRLAPDNPDTLNDRG